MELLALCSLALALAGLIGFLQRRKRTLRAASYQVFRCPRCGHKLRYLVSKAGRPGMCPNCRQKWRLPAPGETAVNAGSSAGRPRVDLHRCA